MPVDPSVSCSKGPSDAVTGESSFDMLVFINVRAVIVIDEIVVANLLVSNKGYQGQRLTN
ncbi:hypothetical protein ES703_41528 [subsurface metagenome]